MEPPVDIDQRTTTQAREVMMLLGVGVVALAGRVGFRHRRKHLELDQFVECVVNGGTGHIRQAVRHAIVDLFGGGVRLGRNKQLNDSPPLGSNPQSGAAKERDNRVDGGGRLIGIHY